MKLLLPILPPSPFRLSATRTGITFVDRMDRGVDSDATNLPTELSEKTLAWKVALPGRGLGSPILVGDRVFVTAASGPDQKQLHILCFSAKDGSPIWEQRFWATGRTMSHKKTNVAAPTPASDGERIYALYSSNDLICLNLDGNPVWMRGLTLDYPNASNSLGMASSPMVAGDTLVAQIENDSESFAAGFDLLSGENKWKQDRPKAANWTSPTILQIGDDKVVALQSSKGIVGVLRERVLPFSNIPQVPRPFLRALPRATSFSFPPTASLQSLRARMGRNRRNSGTSRHSAPAQRVRS